jgi:hypothetical protein
LLLELQIPVFLVRLHVRLRLHFRLHLALEIETNFVELTFSFWAHFAIFKVGTLMVNPYGQFLVKTVLRWYIACNSGRETGGVLGYTKRAKTVDSAKQLTVTIFFVIVLQLLELHIPVSLVHIALDFKTNLVKPLFPFLFHSTIFEAITLTVDPIA